MSNYIGFFIEDIGQLTALMVVCLIWFGFTVIGAAIGSRERLQETDHLVGWALVSFAFTLGGVFLKLPFTAIAVIAALISISALIVIWHRAGSILPQGIGRMLFLGLPLLIMVSAMKGSQWDEFTDWLVIPRYLLEIDGFPNRESPFSKAAFTGYPYSWHFITYLASRVAGRLLESAGALSNVLLLFGFGLLLARLMFIGAGRHPDGERVGWGLAALTMLAVTLINPTFAQKIVLTSYAETSSAVATGSAAILAWFLLEALGRREFDRTQHLALGLGLVLALLINLKQATLVLVVLVVLSALFIAIRDRSVPLMRFLRLCPTIIGPPVVIFLAWRYHLNTELVVRELSVQPFDEWHIDLIPQILAKMLIVLSKKGAYLALVVVIVVFGLRGFWSSQTPFDRFAALIAMVVLGYNTFLLFAYVTTFGKFDALRAASYWRYNMHLGALVVAFAGYGGAQLWRQKLAGRFDIRRLAWLPIALVVIAPFGFAHKLRFDRTPMTVHFRVVGASVAEQVRPEDRIFNVDPRGSGESSAALTFEIGERAHFAGHISAFSGQRLKILKKAAANPSVTTMLVYSLEDGYAGVLGTEIKPGTTYFLRRAGNSWQILNSWDQPPKT